MGEKQSEVKLLGWWASSFCARVVLALKLKGIPYEYVEEDLSNKSELLLQHNPVHKKVPVLVHKGRPIAESLVILEYIDEHWNHSPKLLPEDPYQRARVRFWAKFYDEKIIPGAYAINKSEGKEKERTIEEFSELIKVLEQGIEKDFPAKSSPFFNGEALGFLDIVVGANACNFQAFNEAVYCASFNPQKHPAFFSWVTAMKAYPLMKDTLPPYDRLVAIGRSRHSESLEV